MRFYKEVVLPQAESGRIKNYELQKPYILQPKFTHNGQTIQPIKYVADFFIEYDDGHQEVIDTKGCPDSVAKIKRKMFLYQFPDMDYRWICYSKIDGGWCDYHYVKQQRNIRKKEKEAKKSLKQ